MLLPLDGRIIAYDLIGPETAPVVCMTHSLASDGGMWAEQVPPCSPPASACCVSTCAATAAAIRCDGRLHR